MGAAAGFDGDHTQRDLIAMHYASASPVQRLNEADSLIEYDPPANGTAQYNLIADSLSLQPTATCSSSSPPLPSRKGFDFSLKVSETMQNTIANAASSIPPFMSQSTVGARCNSLHPSSGGVPMPSYMVYPRHGPTLNAAHYPVAQFAIPYSTREPSNIQQVTYPTLQSVSSNFQGIGDDSDPRPLHTAQPSTLLLGGSCGHQTLQPSSAAQPSSSHSLIVRFGLTSFRSDHSNCISGGLERPNARNVTTVPSAVPCRDASNSQLLHRRRLCPSLHVQLTPLFVHCQYRL